MANETRCSSYNTVMCDILKPPEQVPTVQSLSSTSELVSAGPEAMASVAAIIETHPFADPPGPSGRGSSSGSSIVPDRPYSH